MMVTEPELIRTIEEISMNALPSLQTLHDDGWVLRFADGYARRANSVYPLYPAAKTLDEKIDFCESMYRARGLKTVFKLTAAACPPDLDDVLARRGYLTDAATSVQLLDLVRLAITAAPGVELAEGPAQAWLSAYCRMNSVQAGKRATLEHMLRSILLRTCYASITADGQVIACGLGVLQGGWIGLYDIVTDASSRRQGYGRQVIATLLAWGQREGAQRSYLQVMLDNPPALALYASLGYREAYRYWYRVRP